MSSSQPPVLWRLLDGRRGHLTQVEGLTSALGERTPMSVHDIAIDSRRHGLVHWLTGRFPSGENLPPPDLILAAGHATHFAALAARRRYGGRIVVLMKPSLPLGWFDLCVVPEHDQPPRRDNVISTRGVLTTVRPSERHAPDTGLILIGGPSRHHDWDSEAVLTQISEIIGRQPTVRFRVGDSPRTPADTREALLAAGYDFIPWETTEPGEIQAEMTHAGQIWVSEDSASMLYEALGSGAPVGLIAVPRRRTTRICRGVDELIEAGQLTPFDRWQRTGTLQTAPPLDEAGRCADEILRRWFTER